MWFRATSYLALGGAGALWSHTARGTLLRAPDSAFRVPEGWTGGALGLLLTFGLGALGVRSTRLLVEHTQWAARLHLQLRSELSGIAPAQMMVLAGLSACSEELLFRAALGPSLGFATSCALFGLAHSAPKVGYVERGVWAFVMGLALTALYLVTGTLLAPIAAHWAINYENMQYICNYDPTPLDIDRTVFRAGPDAEP